MIEPTMGSERKYTQENEKLFIPCVDACACICTYIGVVHDESTKDVWKWCVQAASVCFTKKKLCAISLCVLSNYNCRRITETRKRAKLHFAIAVRSRFTLHKPIPCYFIQAVENWILLLSSLTILITGCDKKCNSDKSWRAKSESSNTLPLQPP